MRPSAMSFSSDSRATSRRSGSKAEITIASGVSSMMRSTPVAASSARMLRPSRPMILPFRSSEGSSTTDTVASTTAADEARRFHPRVVLDGLDEVPPGIHGRQAGDLLQPLALLFDDLLRLGVRLLDALLGVGEGLLFAAVFLLPSLLLGELAVQVLFLLDHPLLQGSDLLAACLDRLVELGPGGEHLLLGLDRGLAQLRLDRAVGLRQDPVGLRPDVLALGLELLPEENVSDGRDRGGQKEARRDRDREVCIHLGSPCPGARRSLGGGYTMTRKSLSRRGFTISNSDAFKSTTRFSCPMFSGSRR